MAPAVRVCPDCGWPAGAVVAHGGVTLARARHVRDLRAVLRAAFHEEVSDCWFDEDTVARLMPLVREPGAGRPDNEARERRALVAEAERARDDDWKRHIDGSTVLTADLGLLLKGSGTAWVVQITERSMLRHPIRVDEKTGVPIKDAGLDRPWPSVLRGLPDDQDLRRFTLAGGVGPEHPPAGLGTAGLDAVLREAMPDVPVRMPVFPNVVAVDHMPGWPLPGRVLRCLRETFEAESVFTVREPGEVSGRVLDALRARVPLAARYTLVLADIGPGPGEAGESRVELRDVPLFEAGAVAPATAEVTVEAPRAAGRRVCLPVVLGCPAAEENGAGEDGWASRTVVRAMTVQLSPGKPTKITFTLCGPGDVTPDRAHGKETRTWPKLYEQYLAWVKRDAPIDLLFAVELNAATEEVLRRRKEIVEGVIVQARRVLLGDDRFHVGLIGYRQHGTPEPCLAEPHALGPAEDALRALTGWTWTGPPADPVSAAAEEAFAAASRTAWREGGDRFLITVGGRVPHVRSQVVDGGGYETRCVNGLAWREQLAVLRGQGVRLLAVGDLKEAALPGLQGSHQEKYVERIWTEDIGRDGFHPHTMGAVRELLAAVGLGGAEADFPFALHIPAVRTPGGGR
ncbi:hypothetical protein ABGB17_32995 [Sphaerisporangium sp. B11E5]|uniref:hypothetical protein n=1 Tax=Sphaerisporangium sp. B11E5 TaxID=3153563 RepID=UPI00325DED49